MRFFGCDVFTDWDPMGFITFVITILEHNMFGTYSKHPTVANPSEQWKNTRGCLGHRGSLCHKAVLLPLLVLTTGHLP